MFKNCCAQPCCEQQSLPAMAHISSCDLVQPQDQPLCPGTCEVPPRPRTCSHGLPDDVIFKVVELIFDLLLDILSVA
ncbi:unnamed protein product, partial [Polarella glacialis]